MMPPVQSGMQPTMARGGSKNLKKWGSYQPK
jgi:hypothetical protein